MKAFNLLLISALCLSLIGCTTSFKKTNDKEMAKFLSTFVGQDISEVLFALGEPTRIWHIEKHKIYEYRSSAVNRASTATNSVAIIAEHSGFNSDMEARVEAGCILRFAVLDNEVVNYSYRGEYCSKNMVF